MTDMRVIKSFVDELYDLKAMDLLENTKLQIEADNEDRIQKAEAS